MRQLLHGSSAIARAVALGEPQVVAADPISWRATIVERLAVLVARGDLVTEFLTGDSELTVAEALLNAAASGSRAYIATSSQGLLRIAEVLYTIARHRLPVVLTCAETAVPAGADGWSSQPGALAMRDSGWVQLYAADLQEAVDVHLQAFRIAEELRVPVMVNVDELVVTDAVEPVDLPLPAEVERFLAPGSPRWLDAATPRRFGLTAGPDTFLEARYLQHRAIRSALQAIPRLASAFEEAFHRPGIRLVRPYRVLSASVALVCLGTLGGAVEEAVDDLRKKGWPIGAVEIQTYRPFPADALRVALTRCTGVAVLDTTVAPGAPGGGFVATEVKGALYGMARPPVLHSYVVGRGGREVTVEAIRRIALETYHAANEDEIDLETEDEPEDRFVGLGNASVAPAPRALGPAIAGPVAGSAGAALAVLP